MIGVVVDREEGWLRDWRGGEIQRELTERGERGDEAEGEMLTIAGHYRLTVGPVHQVRANTPAALHSRCSGSVGPLNLRKFIHAS